MRRADIEVPNLVVDVNSWTRSACYPRGSFYPLSDGPPTRYHRITLPVFRPCSACRPRSQAPFCQCTQWAIAMRPEGTFGRLRYSLGGDRPSQTARLTRSTGRITATVLESQSRKGGISPLPPPGPQPRLQRLPPILRIQDHNSMSSYSKAPRGLFV